MVGSTEEGVGKGVEKEKRIPAESSPRWLEKGVGRGHTREGHLEGWREREEEKERERTRHARSGMEGRSSPGQGYPPPSLPPPRGSHPLAARAIYHPASTGIPPFTALASRSSLLLLPPNPLYFPTLSVATTVTTIAAATTIDLYSLLLRSTFARSLPGPPRKSFEGNWRVLVSFARESSRTRVSHTNPRGCGIFSCKHVLRFSSRSRQGNLSRHDIILKSERYILSMKRNIIMS